MKMFPLFACAALAGCSTGVVPAGPQTYMISASVPFVTTSGPARAKAYKQAGEWCARRGLVMVPVSIDAQPGVLGQRVSETTMVFRAVPPGDREIQRPNLEKPDVIQRVQLR